MPSIQSKLFSLFLRLINKKSFLKKQMAVGRTNFYSCPEPPESLSKYLNVKKTHHNGHAVFTLSPLSNEGSIHILYLHGGAYVQGFSKLHWYFLSRFIRKSSFVITAPDVPVAPASTYQAVFSMLLEIYEQQLQTVNPENLILMGDSSGGGMALALAQLLKTKGIKQPAQIILFSPWLDITMSNTEIQEIDRVDPFMGIEGLVSAGKLYAGGDDRNHYLLSPINGSIEGLGKISLFAGSNEIMVADARKLKEQAAIKGIDINYFEYTGMVHTWVLFNFPESKAALEQVLTIIRQHGLAT